MLKDQEPIVHQEGETEEEAVKPAGKTSLGKRIAAAANIALRITGTAAMVYGYVEFASDAIWWARGNSNVPPRPEAPVLPKDQEGFRRLEPDRDLHALIRQSLTTYENWQKFAEGRLQPLLNTRQPEAVWELLERASKNFVTEGANVLQTAWLLGYSQDLVQMEAQNLWVNGEHFDLESRYERQLAAAWIQTKVEILDRSVDGFIIKKQGGLDRF